MFVVTLYEIPVGVKVYGYTPSLFLFVKFSWLLESASSGFDNPSLEPYLKPTGEVLLVSSQRQNEDKIKRLK